MKFAFLIIALFFATSGCALIPEQRTTIIQTPLVYSELPAPVRNRIESENSYPEINRIWEIENSKLLYYQLEFNDGSTLRYSPDGKTYLSGHSEELDE